MPTPKSSGSAVVKWGPGMGFPRVTVISTQGYSGIQCVQQFYLQAVESGYLSSPIGSAAASVCAAPGNSFNLSLSLLYSKQELGYDLCVREVALVTSDSLQRYGL